MAKYTALDVAAWFVKRQHCDEWADIDGDIMTHWKLQRLLYYAQGCHLALTGEPLFDEPLIASPRGPVVLSVYESYRASGNRSIENSMGGDPSACDSNTSDILEQVWDAFGCYTASRLRSMVRNERPWQDAMAEGQDTALDLSTTREYFEETYVAG